LRLEIGGGASRLEVRPSAGEGVLRLRLEAANGCREPFGGRWRGKGYLDWRRERKEDKKIRR